jgi:hypothetical protein
MVASSRRKNWLYFFVRNQIVPLSLMLLFFHNAATASANKCLVILLSQTRAYELTYDNIKTNVIDPLEADLAVCIGVDKNYCYDNPFYTLAKYKFVYEESADYSNLMDYASKTISNEHPLERITPWRKFFKLPGNFLGGIANREGSGGILLFARWFLLKSILMNGLLDQYDFFVITRSDYLYALAHPTLDVFSADYIYVPNGEGYGGITDRHVVLPKKFLVVYLDVLEKMLLRSHKYYTKLHLHSGVSKDSINLEKMIYFHLTDQGVAQHIKFFPYVMYTVRAQKDPTRWSPGTFFNHLGYFVKYPSEYYQAIRHKEDFEKTNKTLSEFYKERIQ